MLRRVVPHAVAITSLVCLAAFSGCIFSPKQDECKPGDPCAGLAYRPLTTPYAPIYNFSLTYDKHDRDAYDKYAELFDQTLYKFIWDDPAEPGLDNFYGYVDEMKSREMFLDTEVKSISLTFLTNASDSLGTPSNTVGDPAGTIRFTVNGISLTVERGNTTYLTNGTAEFFVAPIDDGTGKQDYKIIRWRDLTAPPITTAPALANAAPPADGSALLRALAMANALVATEHSTTAATN